MKTTYKNLIKFLPGILISGLLLVSCDDNRNAEVEREYDEFKNYVSTNSDRFQDEAEWEWDEFKDNWEDYDREYQVHVADVEERRDELSEESRMEYDRMKADYDEMRSRYEQRAEMERSNTNNNLSTEMYASVNIQDTINLNMDHLNERNIRSSYNSFILYLDENSKEFTEEDWKNADRIWTAMNERKNSISNISDTDKTELTRLESRYNTYKTNRDNTAVNTTETDITTGTNNQSKSGSSNLN